MEIQKSALRMNLCDAYADFISIDSTSMSNC